LGGGHVAPKLIHTFGSSETCELIFNHHSDA
jgi:hypothetical protein